MGQFSWLYSNTGKQMIDGKRKNSYLLIPEKFQEEMGAKWLLETCYEGTGILTGKMFTALWHSGTGSISPNC